MSPRFEWREGAKIQSYKHFCADPAFETVRPVEKHFGSIPRQAK